MKLQILVPQYSETEEIIKPLLDSIAIQQNVDMDEVGVIICNDGSDVFLSEEFLGSYPFRIEYYKEPHRGVSGTRNACLDRAEAEYVIFCDADDMFYNACGLYILFNEMNGGGFDTMISVFIEETRNAATGAPVYINHNEDSTFVHGKVHRRKYLTDNNIRWNDELTIHEDSYFNCLCQSLASNAKYCPTSFYLWKWRDDSVCRHDPKYLLKTYSNMLDSSTKLVQEFIRRGLYDKAQTAATTMIYDAFFTMNKDEWVNQDNREYRDQTEKRFAKYYLDFKTLFDRIHPDVKARIIMGLKTRFFGEGLLLESITFTDWIRHIETLYTKEG